MTPIMTYTLKADQPRSDRYYRDIAAFTDVVLDHAGDDFRPLIENFQENLRHTGREVPRTGPEYLFELLTLGVLWRVYANRALRLHPIPRRILTALAHARQRQSRLKPAVDLARGMLTTLFLTPSRPPSSPPLPTVRDLHRLLGWLEATSDFDEEVKRLSAWCDYFEALPPAEARGQLIAIAELAAWFTEQSEAVLGVYTPHVQQFIKETLPRYRWR